MAKKRILIVNDLLQGGGVEKLMLDLVVAWHDKYDITVKTNEYDSAFKSIYPANVKYFGRHVLKGGNPFLTRVINAVNKRLFGVYKRLRMTSRNYDVVIAIKDGETLRDVAKLNIPRKLAWVHTDYDHYYYTYGIFNGPVNELAAFKEYDSVVCVAETVKEGIIKVLGDPGNLVVKYNPVEAGEIFDKAEEVVVDLDDKSPDVTRFVTVGRINYQKGFDLLLEASNMLEQEGKQFEVVVVGGKEDWGEEFYKLERAQKRLGVKNVKFIGARKNPYKYIKNADWFISSSLFEGYSYVSQEAAMLDKPMILTDVSGVRELLGDSEYGMVVHPSVYGLYNGMKRIIEDPSLKNYYTEKIKERKAIIKYKERIDAIEELL